MSLFGNRRPGRRGSHSGKECCQDHGHTHGHGPESMMPLAGGALGQAGESTTTVAQPGVEMMPASHGGMAFGGGSGDRLGVLAGMSQRELEVALKDAPGDVLAAAQRLSLIGSTADMSMDDVVKMVPGLESTDTGVLSVSRDG